MLRLYEISLWVREVVMSAEIVVVGAAPCCALCYSWVSGGEMQGQCERGHRSPEITGNTSSTLATDVCVEFKADLGAAVAPVLLIAKPPEAM